MRRSLLPLLALSVLLLQSNSPRAQDDKPGLKPGEFLPGPFQVHTVNGEHAGRLHCLVCERGLNPTVMIFSREPADADKPLGQLLKQLDELARRYPLARFGAFAVFLSDDVSEFEKRQAQAGKSGDVVKALGLQRVTLALDSAAGPKGYNLDAKTAEVVVLYHKHKVLASHTFTDDRRLTAEDVSKILKEVEKVAAEIDKLARPPRGKRPAGGSPSLPN